MSTINLKSAPPELIQDILEARWKCLGDDIFDQAVGQESEASVV